MRIAVLLCVIAACSKAPTKREDAAKPAVAPSAPAGARVFLATPQGELAVAVEVVKSDGALERGLMWRKHLPPDDGMLFLMGNERDWTFWMHNTLIPLDMIFITKDLTVAGVVQNAVPQTDTLRSVGAPSVYVLEVNGGWTAQKGVVAGAKVRFDAVEAYAK